MALLDLNNYPEATATTVPYSNGRLNGLPYCELLVELSFFLASPLFKQRIPLF